MHCLSRKEHRSSQFFHPLNDFFGVVVVLSLYCLLFLLLKHNQGLYVALQGLDLLFVILGVIEAMCVDGLVFHLF